MIPVFYTANEMNFGSYSFMLFLWFAVKKMILDKTRVLKFRQRRGRAGIVFLSIG